MREHRSRGDLNAWLARVRPKGEPIPMVRLENATLKIAVLPSLGGRIWRMTHKPTGRDILVRSTARDGSERPDVGGYEEYSQADYRSPGWNEPYAVTERSANSVSLSARLGNGLELRRTISLDAAKSVVTIDSTLTNRSKGKVTACLRSHPSFAVSDLAKCTLEAAGGKSRPLALARGGSQKDEFLRGEKVPAGQWAIADATAGLRVRSRFDPAHVAQCLLNRSGKAKRVNLELYTKETSLDPGGALRLRHSIEIETLEATGR